MFTPPPPQPFPPLPSHHTPHSKFSTPNHIFRPVLISHIFLYAHYSVPTFIPCPTPSHSFPHSTLCICSIHFHIDHELYLGYQIATTQMITKQNKTTNHFVLAGLINQPITTQLFHQSTNHNTTNRNQPNTTHPTQSSITNPFPHSIHYHNPSIHTTTTKLMWTWMYYYYQY